MGLVPFLRAITWRGDACGWKGRSRLEVLQEPSKKWTNDVDVGDMLTRTCQTMNSTGHRSFLSSAGLDSSPPSPSTCAQHLHQELDGCGWASEVHHGLEWFHGNDSAAGSNDGCDNGRMADKEMTFINDASALSTSENTEQQSGASMEEAAICRPTHDHNPRCGSDLPSFPL